MENPYFTVYKASAGSGKTFTLTVELLSLLLSNPNPAAHRAVLAVTFTNKATLEMKNRILEQLYGLMNKNEESSDYEKIIISKTGLSSETISQRAGEILSHILHDYDHFRIETIDSFFQSILSNLAHELNLPAGLQVDINDREVIEAAVDRLITELQPHTQLLTWTLDYIRERIAENQRWDIRREVKAFAMNLVNEHYLVNEQQLTEVLSDNQRLENYKALLQSNKAQAIDIIQSAAMHMLELLDSYGLTEKSFSNGRYLFAYLNQLQNAVFKEPNATQGKYLDNAENWVRKSDLKDEAFMQLINDELLPALRDTENFRTKQLYIYNSCTLTLQYLNPLRLLNSINNIVAQINREQNRFMLAKTPILLHRIVGNDDASFIFEKAGSRFHHIMIDEFQDTSHLQWQNFKNLLLENLSAGNHCLLVGDIKQSIYRWRNGDWSILHAIRNEFPHQDIAEKHLTTNFRSKPVIIHFNNFFFTHAAKLLKGTPLEGNSNLTPLYADVKQESPQKDADNEGYVQIRLLPEKNQDGESDWETVMLDEMAAEIRQMHEALGVPYSKMAILIRHNKDSKAIVSHFSTRYSDIPLISSEAFLLSSSKAVNTIIHALRYLNDKTDSVSTAYISKQTKGRDNDTIDEAQLYEASESFLPTDFVRQYATLQKLPLYEAIERIVYLLNIHKGNQMAYVQTFLDEALTFLNDHTADITQFLIYWEETLKNKAIPVSDQINGIRILTIHKAKGLQFHTLFMPYVTWKIESDRRDALLWCAPAASPYNQLPIVPISTNANTQQSVYANAYNEEHFQRRIENLNLLYVGFTRAEKNLFVWGVGAADGLEKKNATVGDLTAAVLAPLSSSEEGELSYQIGTRYYQETKNAKKTRINRMKLPVSTRPVRAFPIGDYTQFRQSNQSYEFTHPASDEEKNSTEYILRGNLLHKLFSAISTERDLDTVIDSLQRDGLVPPSLTKSSIVSLFRRGMENPIVADWFSDKWELYRECNILTHDEAGNPVTKRPDRVMINQDETVVVDFKFGNPRDEHREQVAEYLHLLSAMGYNGPRGYLWYVYTNQVVPVSVH